jgi:hypothetical protein
MAPAVGGEEPQRSGDRPAPRFGQQRILHRRVRCRRRGRLNVLLSLAVLMSASTGCRDATDRSPAGWAGRSDTLPSGVVVVSNPDRPLWPAGQEWQVVEELRVGSVEGDGPDAFGRIVSIEVDQARRLWVLDAFALELRVFDRSGQHVRSTGRRGRGPAEFLAPVRVEQGPGGHMWVTDPPNGRLSVFDTAGSWLHGVPLGIAGCFLLPWPGRFDAQGRYWAPFPPDCEALVGYDAEFTPRDTLLVPPEQRPRESFVHRGPDGMIEAEIPFQGGVLWRLSPRGTLWGLDTKGYRLVELGARGDTLRVISREFQASPITEADRRQAREELQWFVDQGGRIDLSRLPRTKPAAVAFFFDDETNIWVERLVSGDLQGRIYDIFDTEGRFLGELRLPFALARSPQPVIRNGEIYGVTLDELQAQTLVRARIVKLPDSRSR